MKFILIQFIAIAAALVSVDAIIPSYIRTCSRNDKHMSACVKSSVENLRPILITGIPELDVPPIDPLHLDELELNLGRGINAKGVNLKLKGGKNFRIEDVQVDVKADTYSFVVSIPEIIAEGNYTIDATIASIPLKGHGPLLLVAKSIVGRGQLHGKKAFKGGQTLYWFPEMSLEVKIADYDIKLMDLFKGNKALGEVTNNLLNEEKPEVILSIAPAIEKALINRILPTANKICTIATFDELFPE
ncbi:uncharacterized protein LOC105688451 [Athalia rosae]|uniref:uncharacterized protein LOC105688451 n=1 Tax=Athalia rosae TaxID=37344 RepID=UPI0020346516|nr:uncharacterized protein LOC105688451 [Athalia rosae]XP_020709447.2 uncharacterized protein LOC105688451 [Athalia rosae]